MSRGTRRITAPFVLAVAGLACQHWSDRNSAAHPEPVYLALRDGASEGRPTACSAAPIGRPRRLLLLTARLCLSCRDVGYLIRQIMADSGARPLGVLQIAVPSSDTALVCEFLRGERIHLPVRVLSEKASRSVERSTLLGYALLDASGALADSVLSADGLSLLESIRSRHGGQE